MKNRLAIAVAVAVVAVLLLNSGGQASAGASRTKVSSYEYVCLTDWGTVWEEGNILHIRGIRHTNVNVSPNPELNGLNTTVADADINMDTGDALIRGTLSWQPEGIDGAWEGYWVFIGVQGRSTGRAVATGTGALAGKTLFLDLYDAEPDPDTETVCAGIGEAHGNTIIEGTIRETGLP